MIILALLVAIGIKLEMGTWYYVLVSISFLLNIIDVMLKIYKKGKEARFDD